MCDLCDDPSRSFDDYLDLMRGKVERYGWALQYVEGDALWSSFAYTIGLTPHGLPELLVTGVPRDQLGMRLNGPAALCLRDGVPPEPGSRRSFADGVLTEAVPVAQPWWHLRIATMFYGTDVRATQLVWQDERGRWPWDPAFREGRGGQPVLGPRARRVA
ncbi:MAG: DUF4262 domain-containing protein [Candidatus Nanopelagicales bacterium]